MGGSAGGPVGIDSLEQQVASIGRQVKELRKQRSLTLDELSAKSGVSVGLISSIERGKGNPSFNTLVQLAHALDTAVPRLFHTLNDVDPVVRKHERRPLSLHPESDSPASRHELMTPSLDHSLEVIWVEEPPNYSSGDTPFQHAGEEVGVIIQGHHRVWLDGVPYDLEPGDAITYPSSVPHWYENPGPDVVKAIWIISPPTF